MTSCQFCGGQLQPAPGGYGCCERCDVMISGIPAAGYTHDYYYALANARSAASLRRAAMLVELAEGDLAGKRCLDFGCNDGSVVAALTARGRYCIGVDINESMLRFARSCRDGDFRLPEEVRELFDTVTAFDVIEHFERPGQFFDAIERYLEPSGRLLITTPNKNSKWRAIYGAGWHGYGIPQYHRLLMSEKFLRHQLERFGYMVEKVMSVPPIDTPRWRLLVASGYRLRGSWAGKLAAAPGSVVKLIAGGFTHGEEDTLYAVARKGGKRWRN
jgi:SAM-dependent methyltransferase